MRNTALIDSADHTRLLRELNVGSSVAENDAFLSDVRVETPVFGQLLNDEIDIVRGTKGSGKTALYRVFAEFLVVTGCSRAAVLVVRAGLLRAEERQRTRVTKGPSERHEQATTTGDQPFTVLFWKQGARKAAGVEVDHCPAGHLPHHRGYRAGGRKDELWLPDNSAAIVRADLPHENVHSYCARPAPSLGPNRQSGAPQSRRFTAHRHRVNDAASEIALNTTVTVERHRP